MTIQEPSISADLAIEYRPVEALIPYARNARTHSDAQVALIAGSIREFGFTNPVLVDGANGIIAGHGRVMAARHLGMTTVPVIELAHLSEVQRRAYVLADNRLAERAGWDAELLGLEVADLRSFGVDLASLGFEPVDLDVLLGRQKARKDEDEAPEPPAVPVSALGDVWLLGRHRLACGDSTTPESVAAALGGARPHLMVTDPPYGVDYDPKWRNVVKRADGSLVGAKATGEVTNDDRADWSQAWALFAGDVAYVWHGALHAAEVAESLERCCFAVRSQIIWRKQQLVIGRGDYHWQHEPCWYAVRKGRSGHYDGGRKQTTVWEIEAASGYRQQTTGPDAHGIHSTQKPVECMRRPIENNSKSGDAVYDPFVGSGTTIIAAEMTGRACHAIELSPAYVDVAVARWQTFTGKAATLDGDGRTFDEVKAERLGVPAEA
jgi:DNA modification methylase